MPTPGQQQLKAEPPAAPPAPPARFQGQQFLGKGGQGFVQLAVDTMDGQPCAIKYIDRGWSRSYYKYVSREILNHSSLSHYRHPHIVAFKEVFLTPRYLGIVMEYVPGCNLQQYLESQVGGRVVEGLARFIFQQLIIALDFCHSKGKVNRDIKLANVMLLLDNSRLPLVKLCDFGFSKGLDDSEPQTQIGTALFTAPEIFTNVTSKTYDGQASDLWSCGVVLFIMLFGSHPFLTNEDCTLNQQAQVMKLISNSVAGRVVWPPEAQGMPAAVDLLKRMLNPNPGERCKMGDVCSHPWFLEKLPPGALTLNTTHSQAHGGPGGVRQTPDMIKQVVRAAIGMHGEPMQPGVSSWSNTTAGVASTATTAVGVGTTATNNQHTHADHSKAQQGRGWAEQSVTGEPNSLTGPVCSAQTPSSAAQQPGTLQPGNWQQAGTPVSQHLLHQQQQQQQQQEEGQERVSQLVPLVATTGAAEAAGPAEAAAEGLEPNVLLDSSLLMHMQLDASMGMRECLDGVFNTR